MLQVPLTQGQQQAVHQATSEETGLWAAIRANYGMPMDTDHTRVRQAIAMYTRYPQFLTRVSARAKPYLDYIVDQLRQRNMPLALALLPIVESGYDPYAYSSSNASGLWQLTAGTAEHFGVHINWWYDGRRSLYASTQAALDYLEQLHQQFGTWEWALAAYNSGAGTVQWAINYNKARGLPTDFWSLPLPAQTRFYVPKLIALMAIIANPEHYHVKLVPVPDKSTLQLVTLHHQIDLSLAARLSGVPLDKLRSLNAGYSRWATPPSGRYHLILPKTHAATFVEKLKSTPQAERVTWIRRRVHNGDTLGGFAYRYGTTVAVLRRINGLSGNLIRVGQELILPEGGGANVAAPQAAVAVQRPSRYRVRSGDSLWTIARRYGVSVANLRQWNHLSAAGVLSVGEVLRLHPAAAPVQAVAVQRGTGSNGAWSNITVTQGDTLSGLAQQYHTTYTALAKWNNMNPDQTLSPGMTLAVLVQPVSGGAASNTVASNPPAADPPPAPPRPVASSSGFTQVQVKAGDSLWLIAHRNGVTTQQLAKWNGLTGKSVLHPGMTLKLRAPAAVRSTAAVVSSQAAIDTSQTVTVQPGDSLWTIAAAHHISPAKLEALNNLTPNSVLHPGMILRLSAPATAESTAATVTPQAAATQTVTVQPGDSLWTIAAAHHISPAKLEALNNLTPNSVLHPGMTLRLSTPATAESTAATVTPQAAAKQTVTVQPGDSLWTIATAHHISLSRLEALNNLAPGAVLHPGMQLLV
ncbi:hypothetical protein BW247_14555 [Acidihalobacter ferrooxydans]|uniref:LysM domain-containing protein n=1 Tax=Acidihalobacter ferrooxydans TaxID=1765967 RepID=A0A1P8UK69_9GAMM|nr:hypothetical protein BW247_14555 [Acidihalobacter ferrooxydans]